MPNEKKISKLVKKFRREFDKAEKNVREYRKEWETFEKRIRGFFVVLKQKHKKAEFYSNLFIQDGDFGIANTEVVNKSHIALRFGIKPLDIKEIKYDSL